MGRRGGLVAWDRNGDGSAALATRAARGTGRREIRVASACGGGVGGDGVTGGSKGGCAGGGGVGGGVAGGGVNSVGVGCGGVGGGVAGGGVSSIGVGCGGVGGGEVGGHGGIGTALATRSGGACRGPRGHGRSDDAVPAAWET